MPRTLSLLAHIHRQSFHWVGILHYWVTLNNIYFVGSCVVVLEYFKKCIFSNPYTLCKFSIHLPCKDLSFI